jgi:hypothetical protein
VHERLDLALVFVLHVALLAGPQRPTELSAVQSDSFAGNEAPPTGTFDL